MSNAARAPGKLILSGEHSVVYGAPALVMAVAKYTTVRFTPLHETGVLKTVFQGFSQGAAYPLASLSRLKDKLDRRFEQFARGERPVQNILHRPDDLVIYTLATLLRQLPMPGRSHARRLPVPGRISTESELPLGAGMGSSAAAIAATLVLYEHLGNHPLTLEQRFEHIRFCERLQHGKGSAIDAAAVTWGGIQFLENGQPAAQDITLDGHWYALQHGIPHTSTGETVAQVRARHAADHALWQQFAACTQALRETLRAQGNPRDSIRENHRLLRHIGIVPDGTAQLIARIEASGGAAKVSGAGASAGEHGGMVLIWHPDENALRACLPGLAPEAIRIAPEGAHLLPQDI
ncbi:MAG: GHMP kinase [Cardiobacteriaceae bacterium]|nr:GHMP kinase [Cardiobacteriaceae bacterium]